jgi:hypothetical protein
MKIECPVCKGILFHKRIDDRFNSHKISKSGKVTPMSSKSDGSDEVYCSQNVEHEIPTDLQEKILDLVASIESLSA